MNRLAALLKRNILSTAIMALIGVAVNADAQTTCAPIQANSIEHNKSGGHAMGQAELEARGKALRQEIDAKFRELEAPGGAYYGPHNNKRNDVDASDIALKYIPIGMSFEDVEIIFKAAVWHFNQFGPGLPPLPNGLIRQQKNTSLVAGPDAVTDMHGFKGFGITVDSGSPTGKCVSTLEASFFKQLY